MVFLEFRGSFFRRNNFYRVLKFSYFFKEIENGVGEGFGGNLYSIVVSLGVLRELFIVLGGGGKWREVV